MRAHKVTQKAVALFSGYAFVLIELAGHDHAVKRMLCLSPDCSRTFSEFQTVRPALYGSLAPKSLRMPSLGCSAGRYWWRALMNATNGDALEFASLLTR